MSAASRECSAQEQPGWRARLALRFAAARSGRTQLAHREHVGPLRVQRPFYPEGPVCHTYVIHPPGGVVGGDRLMLQIDAASNAHALVTTPAAAKFYRSEGPVALQTQTLAANDAVLEWLPQETIFYPGAQVHSATQIDLTGNARFVGWDISCLGLPARAERFTRGRLGLHCALHVDGAPRLIDRLHLAGGTAALHERWGFGGYDCFGMMLAYPAGREVLACVRSAEQPNVEFGASVVDEVLVIRALARQTEPLKRCFIQAWRSLRPTLLQRPACAPRIWAT